MTFKLTDSSVGLMDFRTFPDEEFTKRLFINNCVGNVISMLFTCIVTYKQPTKD